MKYVSLAALGLIGGLGLGLLYAWVISPVEIVDIAPNALAPEEQAAYIVTVARAYAVDQDLVRASTRLALLGLPDVAQAVTALAQRTAAGSDDPATVQALSALAAALGSRPQTAVPQPSAAATASATLTAETRTPEPSPTPTPSATPSRSSTPSRTPLPTDTVLPSITPRLLPTRTPTATAVGSFAFVGRQLVCDPALTEPLIEVVTQARDGTEVPGVEIIVEWDGGFDHFFTGLKPDQGLGYGDFTMNPGIDYTLHLAASPGAVAEGLSAQLCASTSGPNYYGSWLIVFRQP